MATGARAELVFEKPVQEFHRAPEDREFSAKFSFTNRGAEPVTIRRVVSSCGCTTARLSKSTFAGGERGEVEAKFAFGLRRGPQRKVISVFTDDGRESRVELRGWIEDALTVSPALVFWRIDEPAETKQVQLVVASSQQVQVKSVTSSNPRVEAALVTLAAGKRYAVKVKPAGTAQRESAQITVQTDFPPGAPRSYTIHARVK